MTLVIFDCDGILVDSETLAAQVFARQLNSFGVPLNAHDCELQFRGHTLGYCWDWLALHYPGRLPADFLQRLALATQETFGLHLKPVSGVERVLQSLSAQGTEFCVASNGGRDKIQHSLTVTGLAGYFGGRYFSADMVLQGKPAPDLFLLAAQQLGAKPKDCLVIEDSLAGVTAALSAGMMVCCYNVIPPPDGAGHAKVFSDMADLLGLIQNWLKEIAHT